jgi:Ca2+-binding RTX toxin-like protein
MRIGRSVQVVLAGAALGLVVISALAATNTVPGSKAGRSISAITVDAKKPKPQCNAITLTSLVKGTGVFNGTNNGDLIVGGAGIDTINGRNGTDCIIGGAGNDTLTGGAGTDVCIGGLGTDVNGGGCETFIQ